jgi:predicted MFS family arabinose efflux permease
MLVDFGAYLIRPFFSVYWEQVSGSSEQVVSGLVFAIPGAMALLALLVNQRARAKGGHPPDHVMANLLLGAAGLMLQAVPAAWAILLGRVLFGWALFQLVVKLEVLLFRVSTPASYARDFSAFNFFQNLGVLLSSFAAGALVERYAIAVTFAVAAAVLAATALLDRLLLGMDGLASERTPSLEATHAG